MKNSIQLRDLVFPVFRLGNKKPLENEGVLYFLSEYADKDTGAITHNIRVVDDKTRPGTTLGLRRLAMKSSGVSLYPIRTAVYFLGDLIKLANSETWFIDSSGKLFQHKKFKRAKLQIKKITKVLPGTGIGCVLELEGIASRFKCMTHPEAHQKYAGVLFIDNGYILYGLYESEAKESWRLV